VKPIPDLVGLALAVMITTQTDCVDTRGRGQLQFLPDSTQVSEISVNSSVIETVMGRAYSLIQL
jgi:hypothetical protein